jgi:uncharacterized protein YjbJ (UPF0337 family)
VQDTVDRAAEQAQEDVKEAQDTKTPAAKSSRRDKVRGAATGAAVKVLEIAGSLTGDRRTKIEGFLARRKGVFDKKRASRRNCSASRISSTRGVQDEQVKICRSGKAARLLRDRSATRVLPLSKTRNMYYLTARLPLTANSSPPVGDNLL